LTGSLTDKVMRTRTGLAALALLALGTLSGCGGLHPGIAAEAGGQSITDTDVDKLAQDVCTTLQSNKRLIGTGYARSTLLQSVVQSFVMRAMADQMAEQYDVTSSENYDSVVEQTKLQFGTLDPALRARIMDTWTASQYFLDILGSIGRKELEAAGTDVPDTTEGDQQALQKGISLAQDWEAANGVQINPRFPDISLADDSFTRTDDQTAYSVSDLAKQAAAAPPDADWIQSLPPSQRCV
jgi:hypothetical protein